jgi:hypothetical protein
MTDFDYLAGAELYLGRDSQTAAALGPRPFRLAANAIRFAIEHAAPVSLHGARLRVGDREFSGVALRGLYDAADYPLERRYAA